MRWKLLLPLLLLIAAALGAMVILHVRYVNGSPYWIWPWRDTSLLPAARWYPFMLLAAAPVIAAIAWAVMRPPQRASGVIGILALLMIGVIAMKLTSLGILMRPASFDAMEAIVRSPSATSYYTDAAAIDRAVPSGWLAIYPDLLPQMNLHTQSKPPGAVAYYLAWIRALGYGRASAVAGAIGLALIAAFSIPATYWLALRLLSDSPSPRTRAEGGGEASSHVITHHVIRSGPLTLTLPPTAARLPPSTGRGDVSDIALLSALMLALCPGYVLIFPTFDACYPILTAGLIGTWHLAFARNDWRFAAAFGVILGITTFITYNLLVLGVFLAAWPLISGRAKLAQMFQYSAIALGCLIGFYALLALFTQFNPIATFRSAWHNQQVLLAQHPQDRPYPATILFDLLDFALGAGWLPVVLAAMSISARRSQRRLILLCLAQPVVVAVLGILQSETARAWNFMLPLLLIPAALELSRWPPWPRAAVLLAMLALMLIVGHHMIFMVP